ncbi:tetratricopeptide repeat protein [Mesorhizobium sp. LHD-90]|uniref:tetratricopeptide repeat protein n=1 Tax=Mesorhizobium sp. LHD-90 TaxID=3071414 RepID=UPI0027E0D813|nr:tetratricopeptide repeat protein [Mesorhizobium sp. LHD-90]MDQ6433647.1 tetratricopeptide repeat protein [Mesorhizobium sp. LHD-90]
MALNIVASLGRFHELFVIDLLSTLAYRNRPVTSAEAARELSVRYILEGSVQKAGDRIRVSVQLVDGADNRQLWTETYDRYLTDIFAVQDEITGTIIGTLASGYGGRLGKAWRDRNKPARLESFAALDHLLRAIDTCRFTKEGEITAREHLARAIECDPGLAKAYSKMALSHLVEAYCGWADDYDASMELARQWAMKAIACDDGDSSSYWAFANYHLYTLNHGVALEAFRRALECNPNDAEAMTDYGLCLSYAGRAEEGIEHALKAMRLNPYHFEWYTSQLGQIYFDARQYDKAIATFAGLRSLESALTRIYQAASFAAAGNQQQARKSVHRALELDRGATLEKWTDAKLAPYGDAGYLEHLRRNLRKAGLPERTAPHDEKPSIAILPFDNMSGDPEQDYFSDGITEDIIAEIGKYKEFLVIARNSSFQFRKAHDLAEVAGKLGVQYVVEGSVRKIGNRVRISVQLTDASSTAHIWGEHYDRELDDIFAIQDEITRMIAARLARQARTAIASRARARPTDNMSAYEFYLRALQLAAVYDAAHDAEPFLRQAIKLDPRFAAAHAMLGVVETLKFFWIFYEPGPLHSALEMAKTALELDPDEVYGHLATGFALLYLRQFRQAEISLDRAVALNPNDPFILSIRALFLNYTDRPEEGLAEINEAQRRDPYAVGWYEDFRGILLTTAGRYREATACYAKMAVVPRWSLVRLVVCHCELGEISQAQDTLAKVKAQYPALSLDEIVDAEVDYYADPGVCSRYRAILRRLDHAG